MGQSYLPESPGLTLSVAARRWLVAGIVALLLSAVALGLWIGRSLGRLDEQYLLALETMRDAYEARLAVTQRELTDSRLAYDVEKQTLSTLREDLRVAHEESVALREEVTFYRSLMAPDRVAKGLQIAEFEANEQADGGLFLSSAADPGGESPDLGERYCRGGGRGSRGGGRSAASHRNRFSEPVPSTLQVPLLSGADGPPDVAGRLRTGGDPGPCSAAPRRRR